MQPNTFSSGLLLGLVRAYFVDEKRTVTWAEAYWLAPEVLLVKDSGGDFSLCALRSSARMPEGTQNSYGCFERYPAWSLDLSTVEGAANTGVQEAFDYAKNEVKSQKNSIAWYEKPEVVSMSDLSSGSQGSKE